MGVCCGTIIDVINSNNTQTWSKSWESNVLYISFQYRKNANKSWKDAKIKLGAILKLRPNGSFKKAYANNNPFVWVQWVENSKISNIKNITITDGEITADTKAPNNGNWRNSVFDIKSILAVFSQNNAIGYQKNRTRNLRALTNYA
eukprot:525018_1